MASDQVKRKLAAILAADIAGYSRLMGADEAGTLARLKEYRRELIEPKNKQYRGRVVKTTGDGILIEFPSVVDAVSGAIDIQQGMQQRNSDFPPEKRIEFRIGVNLGDVIIDGRDLYGDWVNIVARLEGLAEPGGICISQTVLNHTRGKIAFDVEDLGERDLKNIAQCVHVYRIVVDPAKQSTMCCALELDPGYGVVAALAGSCHMDKVLWGHGDDPQFDRKEAVRLAELALRIDDGDPETLAWASLVWSFMVGDCEGSIEMADRAVALNPNSFLAWNTSGWVYRNAGQPDEALRSFERAIRVNPVDPLLHRSVVGTGAAFIELGRFDEAITASKKSLRQNPVYSSAYRCLVSALTHVGRKEEAREAATRLLEVDPAFTISAWLTRSGQTNSKLLIEGLRKAGLPE